MSETLRRVTLAAVAIASLAAALIILPHPGSGPQSAQAVALEVGVDVNTTGNNATTVGTVENCRVVSLLQTFDIDIYFKNGISNLIAAEAYFQYNASRLQIQSYQILFQGSQSGSSVTDGSETLPDTNEPGVFRLAAVETAQTGGDTGLQGVLFRLTVKAIANGLSPTKISKMDLDGNGQPDRGITLKNNVNLAIGDTDGDTFFDGTVVNGGVFVGTGSTCSTDTDSDGVPDVTDNCPSVANPSQADWNSDGIGDACQDTDGDGRGDSVDNCPGVANANQADMDGDGIGDACDLDKDGDGVNNATDNCPDISNPTQSDIDGDGLGDACDSDRDNDYWINTAETTITTNPGLKCGVNAWPPDFDGDTNINILDVLALKPVFLSNQGDGRYVPRKDISPTTAPDGKINILDVLAIKPYFLKNCSTA